ncbi:hypothetical protein ANTPLA_LOCUS4089 [Anthophora plagiata]
MVRGNVKPRFRAETEPRCNTTREAGGGKRKKTKEEEERGEGKVVLEAWKRRSQRRAQDPFCASAAAAAGDDDDDCAGSFSFLEIQCIFSCFFWKGIGVSMVSCDRLFGGLLLAMMMVLMNERIQVSRNGKCIFLFTPFLFTPHTFITILYCCIIVSLLTQFHCDQNSRNLQCNNVSLLIFFVSFIILLSEERPDGTRHVHDAEITVAIFISAEIRPTDIHGSTWKLACGV